MNSLKNAVLRFGEYTQSLSQRYAYLVAIVICAAAAVLSMMSFFEGVPIVPFYFAAMSAFTGFLAWRYYNTRMEVPQPVSLLGSLVSIGLLIMLLILLVMGW